MTQENSANKPNKPCSGAKPCRQPMPNLDAKIKEIVLEALIELELIPKAERKNGLPDAYSPT